MAWRKSGVTNKKRERARGRLEQVGFKVLADEFFFLMRANKFRSRQLGNGPPMRTKRVCYDVTGSCPLQKFFLTGICPLLCALRPCPFAFFAYFPKQVHKKVSIFITLHSFPVAPLPISATRTHTYRSRTNWTSLDTGVPTSWNPVL